MSDIIRSAYEQEEMIEFNEDFQEKSNKTLSVVTPVETAAMLKAIAKRFNASVSGIASECLIQETLEMFQSLKTEDRLKLALQADDELKAHYKASGFPDYHTAPWVKRAENQADLPLEGEAE